MIVHRFGLFAMAVLAILISGGCEKEEEKSPTGPTPYTPADSVWEDGEGGWYARLNAAGSSYRYFNLVDREVVSITDPEALTNSQWHLAFKGVNGKLNGGISGPLGVKGVDLATIGHPDSVNYERVTSLPAVDSLQWKFDQVDYAVNNWWSYDFISHTLRPTRNLYVLITATGKYAKMVVDSIKGARQTDFTIKFVYQPDGTRNLSGPPQYAEISAASGVVYFSFAQGSAVNIPDPAASTEWDFAIDITRARTEGYLFKLNGSIHGPGSAAAYPMYQENNDFDAVTEAPATAIGQGYFQDGYGSIFGFPTRSGSGWYNYNPVVHEIVSKRHVYLLSIPVSGGTAYFKLQIVNYYLVVAGVPQSRWVTFRFGRLSS